MRIDRSRIILSITVLLIAGPVLVFGYGVGFAKPIAVVTLQDGAVVSGDAVLLGKIAQLEGPEDLVPALAEVVIGRAPLPGKERVISVGYVEVRLRQVGISTKDVEVRTSNGEQKIVVRAEGTSAGVAGSVEPDDDSVTVWCLVSGVERHAPITLDLVEQITVSRQKFVGTPIQSKERLTGMRAKRTLRAGEVLTEEILEPIPLVSRGQKVVLRATYGGVEVTAIGVAESDGMLGDVISVVNSTSGKAVHAYVVGEGIVEALGTE